MASSSHVRLRLASTIAMVLLVFCFLASTDAATTTSPLLVPVRGDSCLRTPCGPGNCTQKSGFFLCECPVDFFGYLCHYNTSLQSLSDCLEGKLVLKNSGTSGSFWQNSATSYAEQVKKATQIVDFLFYMPWRMKIYGSVVTKIRYNSDKIIILFKFYLDKVRQNYISFNELNKILFLSYRYHKLFTEANNPTLTRVNVLGLNGGECSMSSGCLDPNAACDSSTLLCTCQPGYVQNVTTSMCIPNPCNSGKYIADHQYFFCQCPPADFGFRCQYNISVQSWARRVDAWIIIYISSANATFGINSTLSATEELARANTLVTAIIHTGLHVYGYASSVRKYAIFLGCRVKQIRYLYYTTRYMSGLDLLKGHRAYYHQAFIYGQVGRACINTTGCVDDHATCEGIPSTCLCKTGYQHMYNAVLCVKDPCSKTASCGNCTSMRGTMFCDCPLNRFGGSCNYDVNVRSTSKKMKADIAVKNKVFGPIRSVLAHRLRMMNRWRWRLDLYIGNTSIIHFDIYHTGVYSWYSFTWTNHFLLAFNRFGSFFIFRNLSLVIAESTIYGRTGGPCKPSCGCVDEHASCAGNPPKCTCVLGYELYSNRRNTYKCASDMCKTLPCMNGGICTVNGTSSFFCKCPWDFVGNRCQTGICSNNPCQNGGICSTVRGYLHCECVGNYLGKSCQMQANRPLCTSTASCQANDVNSICQEDPSDFFTRKCFCRAGYIDGITKCTKVDRSGLFPFGGKDSFLDNSKACPHKVKIQAFNVFGKRYTRAYVTKYGYITFKRKYCTFLATPLPVLLRNRVLPIIAPFHADNDPQLTNGRVYYRVYDARQRFLSLATWRVMSRVDAEVQKARPSSGFSSTWLMTVTWYKMPPYPYYRTGGREINTYQLVLAMDQIRGESYAMFLYKNNSMTWSKHHLNAIGISAPATNFFYTYNSPYSTKPTAFDLDKIIGNAGEMGKWLHPLFRTSAPSRAEFRCSMWAKRQSQNKRRIATYMRWLPGCPCTFAQAIRDAAFITDFDRLCVLSWRNYVIYGVRECCYNRKTQLIETTEDGRAGSFIFYSPIFQFRLYKTRDRRPKDDCCILSNLCSTYYSFRPVSRCDNYQPPWIAWFYGDPHLSTLDQLEYTFNGLGEYWLLKTDTTLVQARTRRAVNSAGEFVRATIFSAIAAKEGNESQIHVQMDSNRTRLIIYSGDMNMTDWFYGSANASYRSASLMLSKENGTLRASFPSGFSISLTLKFGKINVIVSAPSSFYNKTSGLLGVFNKNPDDDLTTPNGTVLPKTSSEEDIYYNFGELWKISPHESVFYYAPGESAADFNVAGFIPSFGISFSDNRTKEKGEELCSHEGIVDKKCLYDYASTGDEALAKDTLQQQITNKEQLKVIALIPPNVMGPSEINATVGKQTTFTVTAYDANGDNVTFHVREAPADAKLSSTSVTPKSSTFSWTPRSIAFAKIRIYAMDSTGESSPDLVVKINMCDCSEHGECSFDEPADEQPEGATNFVVASCECSLGWDGDQCELDFDACAQNPCTPGTNCTDLTPEQQTQNAPGYVCSECPAGYITTGGRCEDINECAKKSVTAPLRCVNSQGSYHYECENGYRLVNSTQCQDIDECIEGTSNCAHSCKNSAGSYQCECYTGYSLNADTKTCDEEQDLCNGTNCVHGCRVGVNGTKECFCPMGYVLAEDRISCKDIDECIAATHSCGENANCSNTNGTYACICDPGFTLLSDGRRCQGCEANKWGPGCSNFCSCPRGTACNPATGCERCPDGFTGGSCDEDIDECKTKPQICGDHGKCINQVPHYTCQCEDGYIFENGTCHGGDTTAQPTSPDTTSSTTSIVTTNATTQTSSTSTSPTTSTTTTTTTTSTKPTTTVTTPAASSSTSTKPTTTVTTPASSSSTSTKATTVTTAAASSTAPTSSAIPSTQMTTTIAATTATPTSAKGSSASEPLDMWIMVSVILGSMLGVILIVVSSAIIMKKCNKSSTDRLSSDVSTPKTRLHQSEARDQSSQKRLHRTFDDLSSLTSMKNYGYQY